MYFQLMAGELFLLRTVLKPRSIPLIGIAHNYKTKRLKKCDYMISVTKILIDDLASQGFSRIFSYP